MMIIREARPLPNYVLSIISEDGRAGLFDVSSYLDFEAFEPLRDPVEFARLRNGRYFVEWGCGADLSADTLEARWVSTGAS